ncbi:type VI secretion system Vgr family protein [Luteibacter sp. 22Crub2.1]|uniref:type VI secretion system Vgr family protein n=1 Tax=Luteibacter sp. 22Crub2.1 TaxID=1283288 RepID=UPI0009D2CE92|nr:type VI secretion system Vgr family protein [Luteibacter sp. 22Crub2.1]SKB88164.1 type VI secretion system secreted protein VgrG [Luteibacter sp. 22Crub2.1]
MYSGSDIDDYYTSHFQDAERMLSVAFDGGRDGVLPPSRCFLPFRLEFSERLSQPFRAVLYGITPAYWEFPYDKIPGDRDVEPHADRFLGLSAAIRVRAEGRVRAINGVVTAARHLGNWYSKADYTGHDIFELVIEAPLRLFDMRRASRIYQERSTRGILHELLAEHRFMNMAISEGMRAAFETRDRADRDLVRSCRMQFQESDLDFIHRLLVDEGLIYVLEAEHGRNGYSNAWHIFSPEHYFGDEIDATLDVTPDVEEGELMLLGWQGRRKLVPPFTRTISHEYKDNDRYVGRGEGRVNYGHAQTSRGTFGNSESLPPRAVLRPVRGNHEALSFDDPPLTYMDAPAKHRQWAYEMEAEVYHGATTAPLTLAKVIRVLGLDGGRVPLRVEREGTRPDERRHDYIVTAQTIVTSVALRGPARGCWATLADQLREATGIEMFPDEGDSALAPMHVTFEAQPFGKPLVAAHPNDIARPHPGPMTATVVGRKGSVVSTDALGRIAVKFHWQREPDSPVLAKNFHDYTDDPPVNVRYVHPGAGEGMGMQYLPRVGDEVLILFIDNDMDRPIAVGSVHNGKLGTPSFGGVSQLPLDAALTGLRTGEHKGGGANEMVFDDTTDEVGLRLGSTTAATDLSLGHIGTPRARGEARARGTGAELRTDGAAALRAARGILLSTHASTADAQHLEHSALSALLDDCRNLVSLTESNIRRRPELDDAAAGRDAIVQSVATWNSKDTAGSGSAVLAVSSPDGIVAATDASTLAVAGAHMDLVAAKRLQLHSGAQTTIAAQGGIALNAVKNGVAIEAVHGDVTLGAHDGQMSLIAHNDLSVRSVTGTLQIRAPVIELISGNGSYIRLGTHIELGSPEDLVVKTPDAHFTGKGEKLDLLEDPAPDELNEPGTGAYGRNAHSQRRARTTSPKKEATS